MLWVAGLIGVLAAGSVTLLSFEDEDEQDLEAEGGSAEDATGEEPARVSLSEFLFGNSGSDGDDTGGGTGDDTGEDTVSGPVIVEPLPPTLEPDSPVTDSPAPPSGVTLTGTEGLDHLDGADGDDTLDGLGGDDQINGRAGDDSLTGGDGDDQLYGGEGSDALAGDAGADLLHGEAGEDTLLGGGDADTLFGHDGADSLNGGEGDDEAHGGQDSDTLDGGTGADSLHGNDGDDFIRGGSGEDALFGGEGNDTVNGADDSAGDFVNGGDGDDLLAAGAGDVVTGGDGADNILLGDWIAGGTVELIDYDATEDQLMVVYDEALGAPEVEVSADPDTPEQMIVSLDGDVAMYLLGAEGLTAADILLVEATDEDFQYLPLG